MARRLLRNSLRGMSAPQVHETPDRLARWDRKTRWLIVAAAIAPFVAIPFVPDHKATTWLVIDLVSWGVFVIDFVVRQAIDRRYYRSGSGVFDLAIVILTFPWYILPFGTNAAFMSVFRIARLLRLVTATQLAGRATRLIARLGRLGLALAMVSLFSAVIVMNNEPPESGFDHFGDALWWTVVSFTTVGYGDLYPVTPLGRFAGLLMMLAGLAALGSVSAILADALRSDDSAEIDAAEEAAELDLVLSEVQALRGELAELKGLVAESLPQTGPDR